MPSSEKHDDAAATCPHPDCVEASGYQCELCGHYFRRSRIADIQGQYFCRQNAGHNRWPDWRSENGPMPLMLP